MENIPLVEAGPQEEAPGTFGAAAPILGLMPEGKNYASDEKTVRRILDDLFPLLKSVRDDRSALEDEWHAIRRMEMLVHDGGRRYFGRTDAYIPVFARTLDSNTSTLSKGLFPSDEYMDVMDRNDGNPDRARPVKQYMQWEFEVPGKVRARMKPFLRQFASFGTSVLKHMYKKEIRSEGRSDLKRSVLKGTMAEGRFKQTCYDGLFVSSRNLFNWYIYPQTAESIREAQLIFEDIEVPRTHLLSMKHKKRWENVDEALKAGPESNHDSNQQQQLADTANLPTHGSSKWDSDIAGQNVLTEIWCFLHLPRTAYLPHENPEEPLPTKIIMSGNIVLECTRNPFWHQRPPYEVGRMGVEPGFFYGVGWGRRIRSLQYLANDFSNQTNDNLIYSLNPVQLINTGLMAGPMAPMAPGRVYPVLDVDAAIKFERPPSEQVQQGLGMLQFVISMIQDMGGAPAILQGLGAGKGAKTATSAQILQKNALTPLQDIVEDIELDVMVPLMQAAWVNAQQYREEEVMIAVAGQSLKISPEQLAGDYDFRWLASSQAMNQQVRAQQAMQLIQAVAPLVPLLAQQNKVVDFEALVERIYTDGFGFRNFSSFIRPAQVMPGGPMGAMGAMQESGDRMRSAVEQAEGGQPVETQPGESEDFMAVRAGADDMAGNMGGQ